MTVDDLVKATNGYYLANKARSGTGVIIGRVFENSYELTPEGTEMAATLTVATKIQLPDTKPATRPRKTEKSLIE